MHAQPCCARCCCWWGRSPNKILYSRSSGRVWQTDLVPTYDGTVCLERNEPVPFRLTRNLVAFFSLFGVDGIFITTMVSAAQVGTLHESLTLRSRNHRCARDFDLLI